MTDLDPFEEDFEVEESPKNNRFGNGSVRRALSRWWILVIFGALGYAGALYYMSIMPPSVSATAVLEVNLKERQLIGAELESEMLQLETRMGTIASKMLSPESLTKAASSPEVQALKNAIPPAFSLKPRYWRTAEELEFKPADSVNTGEFVGMMVGWIKIEPRPATSLIDISCSHQDAEVARTIADAIMKVYLENEKVAKSGGADIAFTTLKAEMDGARAGLEEAQSSLQVYVNANKLSDQIQEQRNELILLQQRYKAKHPKMVSFQAVYRDLNQRFRREIKRASMVNTERSYWLKYREQLDDLDKRIEANKEEDTTADEWLTLAQNALAARANILQARVSQQQGLYDTISKRITEIDVSEDDQDDEYKVMQSAFVSGSNESTRLIYLLAGSLVGIGAGFGLAYILGIIDYKIYDVRSVEDVTGLNCMAAIPLAAHFKRGKEWLPVLVKDTNAPQSEAIRNLRASVILLGQKHRHKTILVTSAIPGEGKTTVASELAAAFALNGERTLLVGLDLRKPRLEGLFPEIDNHPGISEVLSGQADLKDCVVQDHVDKLYVLGAGSKCANPSELLHEEELHELFIKLSANFDRIIIDSAPILPVSDSRVIARFTQSVILVVRARKAPVGAIMRSIELLKLAGKPPVGVVINGMKGSSGSGYYGYKGYGEYKGEYGYYTDQK